MKQKCISIKIGERRYVKKYSISLATKFRSIIAYSHNSLSLSQNYTYVSLGIHKYIKKSTKNVPKTAKYRLEKEKIEVRLSNRYIRRVPLATARFSLIHFDPKLNHIIGCASFLYCFDIAIYTYVLFLNSIECTVKSDHD